MRFPRLVLAALPCALLLLSLPLAAQQVYKWKDAKGVTQYTATPPPQGGYETRRVDQHQAPPATAEKPAEDPACAQARSNLALLKGQSKLQVDSDGDGKPDKTLSDADRADQRALTEATIKVKCAAAPPPPAESDDEAGEEEPEEL